MNIVYQKPSQPTGCLQWIPIQSHHQKGIPQLDDEYPLTKALTAREFYIKPPDSVTFKSEAMATKGHHYTVSVGLYKDRPGSGHIKPHN